MWQIFPSISDIWMKPTQYVVTLPNWNNRKIEWNILLFYAIFVYYMKNLIYWCTKKRTNLFYFFSQLATLLKMVTRDSINTISDKLVVFNNYNTHNNVNI